MNRSAAVVLFSLMLVVSISLNALAQDDFHRGISLYEEGKLAEAKAAFESALQATPEDSVVLTWCGTVALELDQIPAATEYLEQAVAQDAESQVAHNNLGNAYAAAGRLEED